MEKLQTQWPPERPSDRELSAATKKLKGYAIRVFRKQLLQEEDFKENFATLKMLDMDLSISYECAQHSEQEECEPIIELVNPIPDESDADDEDEWEEGNLKLESPISEKILNNLYAEDRCAIADAVILDELESLEEQRYESIEERKDEAWKEGTEVFTEDIERQMGLYVSALQRFHAQLYRGTLGK